MASALLGGVTARLIIRLGGYAQTNRIGSVYPSGTIFLHEEREHLPHIGFVSAERLPTEGEPKDCWRTMPDLSVELISPTDTWGVINQKRRDYFAAGVREVWLISLEAREAQLWTSPFSVQPVSENEDLVSETLLPGFRCRLGDLFQAPVKRSA